MPNHNAHHSHTKNLVPSPFNKVRNTLLTMHPGDVKGGILRISPDIFLQDVKKRLESVSSQREWQDFYYELFQGSSSKNNLPSLDEIEDRASEYYKGGMTPIVISNYEFSSILPNSVKLVPSESGNELDVQWSKQIDPAEAFTSEERFFATALFQDKFDYFVPRTPFHFGLNARFIVPASLFLSNIGSQITEISIDFGDGQGSRPVALEEVVEVLYVDEGTKKFKLTAKVNGKAKVTEFTLLVKNLSAAPQPDQSWSSLTSPFDFENITATGHAWVYYGSDNGSKHTEIVNPVIISEGFPGNYSLNYLWWSLEDNAQNLATTLLNKGFDLVILGYDNGTTYIEANAGVVVACVQQVIANRHGVKPLVVGGACMGGVVVRYALAYMETNDINHETSLYFSIDSPHNGINTPAGVQFMLDIFAPLDSTAAMAWQKLQDPAGQELLLYAVYSFAYPPVVPSDLRTTFLQNLQNQGNFPVKPKKIGIADGCGTGQSNGVPPSADVFSSSSDYLLYTAPGGPQGEMFGYYDMSWLSAGWPDCPFSVDSAPGSIEAYFSTAASALNTTSDYPDCCFVPTISALSMSGLDIYTDSDLYTPLNVNTPPASDLDAYLYNTGNAAHMQITAAMAKWLVDQLT